ncbi:uncharacterized protein C6orf132 homolog [Scleropages formosus]|uniref:uncharacterized protein C6orf132 homolog n=1 Tax=Scleropages formosus TaxID=113540 RepID=UPI0008787ED9|nr:uncharacterized protein C6orf132 homolog [Scleropages formosus]
MKKGALNFLSRKNQSLFDPKLEIKELENADFVWDSLAIPESGTANVRFRPTVKHNSSSSDVLQGFAVPTPKAPLLPSINGLHTPERVNGDQNSRSGPLAIRHSVEGEIFIPPPPSMAPPPPPQFIPPPPEFGSRLNSSYESPPASSLQPPPMSPPKPPSQLPAAETDLASLKPPSMAPPKPPIKPFSTKPSDVVGLFPSNDEIIPEKPTFLPPQPPTLSVEQPQIAHLKSHKVPPPKPVRLSSIPSQNDLPSFIAPALSTNEPTPSSFNPQNSAKLYNVPNTPILSGQKNHEIKSKSIIILQDPPTDNHTKGKVPSALTDVSTKSAIPPVKPARRNSSGMQLEKDVEHLKYNLQSTLPSQTRLRGINVSESLMKNEDPPEALSKLQDVPTVPQSLESSIMKYSAGSPARTHKSYSAYSHIPYGHRSTGSSPSPMALLQAAKEREKQKRTMSEENYTKTNSSSELPTMRIYSAESRPNSIMVVPRSTLSSSQTGQEQMDQGQLSIPQDVHSMQMLSIRPYQIPQSSESIQEKVAFSDLKPSNLHSSVFSVSSKETKHQPDVHTTPTVPWSNSFMDEENGEDMGVPLIPPPPEFANSDIEDDRSLVHVEQPPNLPPPDPPSQKSQSPASFTIAKFQSNIPARPSDIPLQKSSHPSSSSVVPTLQRTSPLPTPDPPSEITQPSASSTVPALQINSPAPSDHSSQKITQHPVPAALNFQSSHPAPPPDCPPQPPILPPVPIIHNKGPPPPPKPKPYVTPLKPNMKTNPLPHALPKGINPMSPSQATLLSILQKKMLEMDQKHLLPQVDSTSDDWGTPFSDEESGDVFPKKKQLSQSQSLDLGKLESKEAKRVQASSVKPIASKGPQSKPPCGMTFTVRPGSKQPITLISKEDSS